MEFYIVGSTLKVVQVSSYYKWAKCNSCFTLREDQFQFTDFLKSYLKCYRYGKILKKSQRPLLLTARSFCNTRSHCSVTTKHWNYFHH